MYTFLVTYYSVDIVDNQFHPYLKFLPEYAYKHLGIIHLVSTQNFPKK